MSRIASCSTGFAVVARQGCPSAIGGSAAPTVPAARRVVKDIVGEPKHLIARHTIVYDSMGLLQQVGIMPAADSAQAKLIAGLQRVVALVAKTVRHR